MFQSWYLGDFIDFVLFYVDRASFKLGMHKAQRLLVNDDHLFLELPFVLSTLLHYCMRVPKLVALSGKESF